jgi:hypothetical protein
MPLARADLESLLRMRQLDRTLTTSLPPLDPHNEYASGPTGVTALDARLGGGFPRGHLSEIAGARSSGRLSLLISMLAAATARGELVALVDALDMFDPESAAAAGVDLDRLLWIRGHVVANPGLCRDMNQRALEQAIRALTLVLQAGNFGVVAFDAGEAPAGALRRLPFTTWMRLQRMVEGRQTICVLIGSEPMARSSAGLTLRLGSACGHAEARTSESESRHQREVALGVGPQRQWKSACGHASPRTSKSEGEHQRELALGVGPQRQWKNVDGVRFGDRLFCGLDIEARVVRARARGDEDVRVLVSTVCV